MKKLTIGRDESCDIIIDDTTDMVSRCHAVLYIHPIGKMEIVPSGRNGTFLNGKELKKDKIYRVRRSDVISFARVKSLDWKDVPRPYAKYWNSLFVFLIVVGLLIALNYVSPMMNWGCSQQDSIVVGDGGSGSMANPSYDQTDSATKVDTTEKKDTHKKFKFPSKDKGKENGSKSQKKAPSLESNEEPEIIEKK